MVLILSSCPVANASSGADFGGDSRNAYDRTRADSGSSSREDSSYDSADSIGSEEEEEDEDEEDYDSEYDYESEDDSFQGLRESELAKRMLCEAGDLAKSCQVGHKCRFKSMSE